MPNPHNIPITIADIMIELISPLSAAGGGFLSLKTVDVGFHSRSTQPYTTLSRL